MNVFAKNTTASAITVASWTVSYINGTDAELVEVEGTGGAVSNTATIYIRRYKCGYDITLTQPGYENFSGVLSCELKGVIYTNYQQTTTQTCNYSGDVTFTNGSGTVEVAPFSWTYYGDSITQHDCADNTPVKYNAFKYNLNGTPYYYVLDGIHDTWTDDLSAWGYSEVRPVVELPTVDNGFYSTFSGWLNAGSSGAATQTIASNGVSTNWYYSDGHGNYSAFSEQYDLSKTYAIMRWNSANGVLGAYVGLLIVNESGLYGVKNTTSAQITVNSVRVAVCSSNQATVVTVYNSSNVAYNAFKFTANGTDYYYVLDGTQTDWVSDLSSIGYYLSVVTAYVSDDQSSAWVDQNGKKLLFNSSGDILYGNGRSYYLSSVLLTSGTSTTDGFSLTEPTALFLANAGSTRKVASVTIGFI